MELTGGSHCRWWCGSTVYSWGVGGESCKDGWKHHNHGDLIATIVKLIIFCISHFQRSEKISVGSTLFMVVLLAGLACFVSLGFGKFQVKPHIYYLVLYRSQYQGLNIQETCYTWQYFWCWWGHKCWAADGVHHVWQDHHGHVAGELLHGAAVRGVWELLVCHWWWHPSHHLLLPVCNIQDQGPRSQDSLPVHACQVWCRGSYSLHGLLSLLQLCCVCWALGGRYQGNQDAKGQEFLNSYSLFHMV